MEMAFWDSIRESTNPADFEAYRQRFPQGTFVELAGNRLAELRGARAPDPSRDAVPAARSAAAVEAAMGMDRAARQLAQLGLQQEGYTPGAADGAFGPGTRAAIRRWQEARGVAATGYLDAAEAEMLWVAGEAQRQTEAQQQAAIVGGNVLPPTKIHDVPPLYPEAARQMRVQGVVIIEAVVGATGAVEDVRVLRSVPLLDDAAITAVRQWRYTPTLFNNVPVPVIMTVSVNFTLQ